MSDRNNDNNTNESNTSSNNSNNKNGRNIISVNISNMDEGTVGCMLHDAIQKRNIPEIMKTIEQHPKSARHKNKYDQYPLHLACRSIDSDKISEKILELYPSAAKEKDINGNLPLHTALCFGNTSEYVVNLLLAEYPLAIECMNDAEHYPLHIACECVFSETVVSNLIYIYPTATEYSDRGGNYPLHAVCGHKDFSVKIAMRLLDVYPIAGMCINSFGNTPLHLACDNCNKHSESLLRRLIKIFPEAIGLQNDMKQYPLHLACRNSHNLSMKFINLLFADFVLPTFGCPVPLLDECHHTPLSYLIQSSHLRLICEQTKCRFHMEQERKKILSIALHLIDAYPYQQKVNSIERYYPLHLACKHGVDYKVILCLLNNDLLAVKQKCDQGKYPLDYAKQSNLTIIVDVLEDLMNKDSDELENRVGIPSIVTSHDINNIYSCSILDWIQCNSPDYIQGKYSQALPIFKQTFSCPLIDNANYRIRKRGRDNDINLECRECTESQTSEHVVPFCNT